MRNSPRLKTRWPLVDAGNIQHKDKSYRYEPEVFSIRQPSERAVVGVTVQEVAEGGRERIRKREAEGHQGEQCRSLRPGKIGKQDASDTLVG